MESTVTEQERLCFFSFPPNQDQQRERPISPKLKSTGSFSPDIENIVESFEGASLWDNKSDGDGDDRLNSEDDCQTSESLNTSRPTNGLGIQSNKLPARFSNLVTKTADSHISEHQQNIKKSELYPAEFKKLNDFQLNYKDRNVFSSHIPQSPHSRRPSESRYSLIKYGTITNNSSPSTISPSKKPSFSYFSLGESSSTATTSPRSPLSPTFSYSFATNEESNKQPLGMDGTPNRRASRASISGNKIGHRRDHSIISNASFNRHSFPPSESKLTDDYMSYQNTRRSSEIYDATSSEVSRVHSGSTEGSKIVYLIDNPLNFTIDFDKAISEVK